MRDGVRGITAGPVACKGRVARDGFRLVLVDAHLKIAVFQKVVDNVLFIMHEAMLSECTHYEVAIRCASLFRKQHF